MHYYLPFQLLNLFYTDAKLVKMKELNYIHEKMSLFSEIPQHVLFFISNNICYESSRYENVNQGEKQKF